MNRSKLILLITGLLVIAAAVTVLVRMQSNRRLGAPGVRMVEQPVFDETGRQINSWTVALPEKILDFDSRIVPISKSEVTWLPKDTTFARRAYRAPDGFELYISVVLMGTDRTSIHRPQMCLPAQGWTIEKTETTELPVLQPHPYSLPVNKLTSSKIGRLSDGSERKLSSLYAYWYVTDGHVTASNIDRTRLMAINAIRSGILQRWAYVSVFVPSSPGAEDGAFARMKQFIQEAVPKFQIATPTR